MTLQEKARRVVNTLAEKELKLATAESCTGGYLAKVITDIPGASRIFMFSIVAYSNEAKMRFLNVKEETLRKYGAVSQKTAEEMASSLLAHGVDIGIAITGIAGPSGGSEEKPVGLVWFAIATRKGITAERHIFSGDRDAIRTQSVSRAMDMVLSAAEGFD